MIHEQCAVCVSPVLHTEWADRYFHFTSTVLETEVNVCIFSVCISISFFLHGADRCGKEEKIRKKERKRERKTKERDTQRRQLSMTSTLFENFVSVGFWHRSIRSRNYVFKIKVSHLDGEHRLWSGMERDGLRHATLPKTHHKKMTNTTQSILLLLLLRSRPC